MITETLSSLPVIGEKFRRERMKRHSDEPYQGVHVGEHAAAAVLDMADVDRVVSVARGSHTDATTDSFTLVTKRTEQREEFAAAVGATRQALQRNEEVLVHCHEGKERAPTVLATALAAELNTSFQAVLQQLQATRPIVNPTPELEELAEWYLKEVDQ